MKRYWVFVCADYCPSGGADDFRDSFDDEELAKRDAESRIKSDFGYSGYRSHVFDAETQEIIARFS